MIAVRVDTQAHRGEATYENWETVLSTKGS